MKIFKKQICTFACTTLYAILHWPRSKLLPWFCAVSNTKVLRFSSGMFLECSYILGIFQPHGPYKKFLTKKEYIWRPPAYICTAQTVTHHNSTENASSCYNSATSLATSCCMSESVSIHPTYLTSFTMWVANVCSSSLLSAILPVFSLSPSIPITSLVSQLPSAVGSTLARTARQEQSASMLLSPGCFSAGKWRFTKLESL